MAYASALFLASVRFRFICKCLKIFYANLWDLYENSSSTGNSDLFALSSFIFSNNPSFDIYLSI